MSTSPEVWLRGPIEGMPVTRWVMAGGARTVSPDARGVRAHLRRARPTTNCGRHRAARMLLAGSLLHLWAARIRRLLTYAPRRAIETPRRRRRWPWSRRRRVPMRRRCWRVSAGPSTRRANNCARRQRTRSTRSGRSGGRALPTTVVGLLFHAAEHSQRHAGQIVTTAALIRGEPRQSRTRSSTRARTPANDHFNELPLAHGVQRRGPRSRSGRAPGRCSRGATTRGRRAACEAGPRPSGRRRRD